MAKLYPPVIEGSLPAFTSSSGLYVPYELNRAVGYSEITGFSYIIKSTVTNKIIVSGDADKTTYGKVFIQGIHDKLTAGGFYKVQIAFKSGEEIGYYSNTAVVKYIGKAPTLSVDLEGESFIGVYEPKEQNPEKLYSYSFKLYDALNNLLEDSGEILHNATKDVGLKQEDHWTPKIGLDNGTNYTVTYSITTINGYTSSLTTTKQAKKDEEGYCPRAIELSAVENRENGYVSITIRNSIQNDTRELMYGKFNIYKTSSKDNYTSKYKIAYFQLENQDLYEKTFKDFTVESGYTYQYILQQENDYGIYSEEVFSYPITVNFDYMFLFDGEKQLKINFNPKISTFKDTILESKTDTIGSQYPFISRNGTVKYKEFNLSGLISYQMDEENLFVKDYEIWNHITKNLSGNYPIDKSEWTHNLTDRSIAAEREFKLKVMDWLNNGEIKLLKTPTEGNYLVRLMNISLTPNDTLGRMLHTFTAQAYEVEDLAKHSFVEALSMDKSNKYIGYRTIPLYDFPLKTIVAKQGTAQDYTIVSDNSLYEIIGNPSQEFVVAARFEDIKPGTKFEVTLERKLEYYIFNLEIGATGFYRIPRELGYHIKSIRLKNPDWITGDYGRDIVNNRGQITYEYERQAKHNNFNDITEIDARIAVAAPWYSTWYDVTIEEPIINSSGEQLYHYTSDSNETAYIETGYFSETRNQKKDGKFLIRGIDYTQLENGNYYELPLPGKEEEYKQLYPTTKQGCPKNIGDAIYTFDTAKELNGTATGESVSRTKFKWQDQTKTLNKSWYYQIYGDSTENKYQLYEKISDGSYQFSKGKPNQGGKDDWKNTDEQINYCRIEKGTVPLFVPQYDLQGNKIYSEIVKEEQQYQNPYYVTLNQVQNEKSIVNVGAKNYKLQPLYIKDLELTEDQNKELNQVKDVIYRNFIPNKYYNTTNPNGDYYIKENIMNIYSMDFELIQVFYQEDLNDSQNFKFDGKVYYKDVYEDSGYQLTERMIEGLPKYNNNDVNYGKNYLVLDDEMIADDIKLENYELAYENPIVDINNIPEELLGNILLIYGYEDKNALTTAINTGAVEIFTKIELDKINDGYYLAKVDVSKLPTDNDLGIATSKYYLNLRAQATKNYTSTVTPGPNEIIVVYEENLSNPVKIDLTNRFSYSLTSPDEEKGFQGIAAIYVGKNVRGFATYKRKKYAYKALTAANVYKELTWKESE